MGLRAILSWIVPRLVSRDTVAPTVSFIRNDDTQIQKSFVVYPIHDKYRVLSITARLV